VGAHHCVTDLAFHLSGSLLDRLAVDLLRLLAIGAQSDHVAWGDVRLRIAVVDGHLDASEVGG